MASAARPSTVSGVPSAPASWPTRITSSAALPSVTMLERAVTTGAAASATTAPTVSAGIVDDAVNGPDTPAGSTHADAPNPATVSNGSRLNCSTSPVITKSRANTTAPSTTTTTNRTRRNRRSRSVSRIIRHRRATVAWRPTPGSARRRRRSRSGRPPGRARSRGDRHRAGRAGGADRRPRRATIAAGCAPRR